MPFTRQIEKTAPYQNIQVGGGTFNPGVIRSVAGRITLYPRAALPIDRILILCLVTKRVTPHGESSAAAGLSPLFSQFPRSRPRSRSISSISGKNDFSGRTGMGNRWLSANGVPANFRL